MDMYMEINRWEDAIAVAESSVSCDTCTYVSTCIVLKFQASQEEWREKRGEKKDIYAVRIVLLHTGTQ